MKPINKVKKGEDLTLLHTELANRVIAACNAVILAEVMPAAAGKFFVVDGKLKLDLSGVAGDTVRIMVLANGVPSWVNFSATIEEPA